MRVPSVSWPGRSPARSRPEAVTDKPEAGPFTLRNDRVNRGESVPCPTHPVLLAEAMEALALTGWRRLCGRHVRRRRVQPRNAGQARTAASSPTTVIPDAIARGAELAASAKGKFTLHQGRFGDLEHPGAGGRRRVRSRRLVLPARQSRTRLSRSSRTRTWTCGWRRKA